MGTIKEGIMGGFSGTVGTVVGGNWNGIDYMRSRNASHSDAKSTPQLIQRARLSAIIQLLKPLKDFLRVGFKSQAIGKSAFNAATSYHMENALTGTFPDYQIDYSRVMVSRGNFPGALNPAAVSGSAAEIAFTWDNNLSKFYTKADDKAVLVIYNPLKQRAITVIGGNTRRSGSQSVALPANFSGDEVHCYISFQNVGQSVVSDNRYAGSVMVL